MRKAYIVAAKRSAIGTFLGSLTDVDLATVGATVLKETIKQRAPKDAIIDISRDDVTVNGLVENVKYVRDKYNIQSDGICDRY